MENPKEKMMIESDEWLVKECLKLLEQYKNCKSEHEKIKLFPKIDSLIGRISFEMKEIEILGYGD